MNPFLFYSLILLSTILVEFIVYWLIIRIRPFELLLYSILINTLTWPLANYSYLYLHGNFYIIEIAVTFAESFLIYLLLKQKYTKAFLISLCANFITALISFFYLNIVHITSIAGFSV
jgi:hypothetical protein